VQLLLKQEDGADAHLEYLAEAVVADAPPVVLDDDGSVFKVNEEDLPFGAGYLLLEPHGAEQQLRYDWDQLRLYENATRFVDLKQCDSAEHNSLLATINAKVLLELAKLK